MGDKATRADRRTVRFKMGDFLPADSPVARFLVRASIIRNDLVVATTSFLDREESGDAGYPPGLSIYEFRISASHLREAAKVLADELKAKEVDMFCKALPPKTQVRLDRLMDSLESFDDHSFVKLDLKPIRDQTFHCPSSREVEAAMRQMAEEGKETSFDFWGDRHIDSRYTFADDVMMGVLGIDIHSDRERWEETVRRTAALVMEYVIFFDEALESYLKDLGFSDQARIEEGGPERTEP